MIVVKIELWPGGNERKSVELGRTYINNTGGTDDRGEYDVRVCRKGKLDFLKDVLRGRGPLRTGHVSDYPRLSYNVWRLVLRALLEAFPEEKVKR